MTVWHSSVTRLTRSSHVSALKLAKKRTKATFKLYLTEFVDQGQGAGCAMEDAAALAVVLQRGVKAEEVPERLRLYEKIRMERANRVQEYSRLAGRDLGDKKLDSKANRLFLLLLPPASHRSRRLFPN